MAARVIEVGLDCSMGLMVGGEVGVVSPTEAEVWHAAVGVGAMAAVVAAVMVEVTGKAMFRRRNNLRQHADSRGLLKTMHLE